MFTTLHYKPLQDLRRDASLLDMHPVNLETEADISLQPMVPGLYGRWDKSEMFSLSRPLWSPLSRAGARASRSVELPKEADPKDSIFHSTDTVSDSARAPVPINDVSGTGIPRSILSHPGFRGIRERATTPPGGVAEVVSSAYQHQIKSVSTDPFPLLKQATSIRSALGNGPELGSGGKAQYGPTSNYSMSPKVPIKSSLTSSKGQQVALAQRYIPTRQYPSLAWSSPAPTKQHDGIDLDPLYHTTINKYFECLQTPPPKLKNDFIVGNRSSTTLSHGLPPFLANKPWVFTLFGRASAFHTFSPLKAEISAPLSSPAIEAFIHPRHRAYFHQFLRMSMLKRIESSTNTKEIACEIVKDGVVLEEDDDSEPKTVDLEQIVQLDMSNRPISAHCRKGSVVATGMMEESDTTEPAKALTPTLLENDNRVTELDPDTEYNVAEVASPNHRRINSLRYTVRQRASLFRSASIKSDFTFVVEVTASPPLKRKHNPKEDSTEEASRKRTRDNSTESSVASTTNSVASRLSILISNAEQRQARLNSPGRELILSPINTQCVQVTERLITEPLLSNSLLSNSIPDSPVTPTSFTESTARSSTHSLSSAGTSLTVPYSQVSPSVSRKFLIEKAWEEEEQLRGRRAYDENRLLYAPGSSLRRSRSTSAIDSERPIEYSVEQTRRRSLSTCSMLTKYAPMLQQPTVISTLESQSLEIEETPSSSGSSSFVEPAKLEDPFISSAPAPQATLLVPEIKPEDTKHSAQKKGFRRISYLGQSKSHKSFIAKVSEPSSAAVASETEDAANKKKKFQKLKNRVKGITKKVSDAIKKEKY